MPEVDDNDQPSEIVTGVPEQPAEDTDATGAQPAEEPAEREAQPAEEPAEAAVLTGAEPAAPEATEPLAEEPAMPAVTHPAPEAPDAAFVEGVSGGVTWIPFAVYLGCWIILAGLSAYLLQGATPDAPAQWMPAYEPLLWGGLGLTALGPLMSIAVWLIVRAARTASHRRGLFASVMTRGALTTFFGVLIWVGTLYVLELLGSGWSL